MHVSYSLPDVNRLDVAAEGALGQVGLPADLARMQLHSGVALRSVSHLRRCHDITKPFSIGRSKVTGFSTFVSHS